MKTCAKCSTTKPRTDFYRDRAKKDGYRNECKDCTKAKWGQYYQANAEREKARTKEWAEANREHTRVAAKERQQRNREHNLEVRRKHWCVNRDRLNAAQRAHYAQNAVAIKEERKAYYAANRAVILTQKAEYHRRNREQRSAYNRHYACTHRESMRRVHKAWVSRNRDRVREYVWRRKALEAGATGTATPEKVAQRRRLYGSRCYLCGSPATTMDHVKPLALGGSNWPSNLRPACANCNSGKRDRWPYRVPDGPYQARAIGGE